MKKWPRLAGAQRREAILRAALPLFAHRGFHGVSTKEIALAARVSEALIFKHFSSKRALYKGLYAYCAKTVEFNSERITALDEDGPGAARLLYFVVRSVLAKRQNEASPSFRLFCHSCLDDGEFAALVMNGETTSRVIEKFALCLRGAIRAGEVVDLNIPPDRLFWLARNTACQVFMHQLSRRPSLIYKAEYGRVFQDVVLFVLSGVGFTPEALRRFASPAHLTKWENDTSLSLLVSPKRRA